MFILWAIFGKKESNKNVLTDLKQSYQVHDLEWKIQDVGFFP